MTVHTRKVIGKRIKALREAEGLNQTKASLMLGLERSYYAKIERGERSCSIDVYEKITEGYGAKLSSLFEGL